MDNKKISLILATTAGGGISYNNNIPWNIPDDLKRFKKITSTVNDNTKRNAIIMGRHTWESLSIKPLPNRLNIVLTSNPEYEINNKDIIVVNSLDFAISLCSTNNIEQIFIIGGALLYNECLNNYIDKIDKIYLTIIKDYYKCDKYVDINLIFNNNNLKILEENIHITKDCSYIDIISK